VATIASGRAALASGGVISGIRMAIAKMIGLGAMSRTISGLSALRRKARGRCRRP
jgi:hypothetical protein